MFRLWRLRRRQQTQVVGYEHELRKIPADKVEARARIQELEYAAYTTSQNDIDIFLSQGLMNEAEKYDVELPPHNDPDMWRGGADFPVPFLTSKGRFAVRRSIDDEKTRRFEVTTRWAKVWVPIITALTGLIGVATGLVAVLQHKK
jgi:hypothetical protein